MLSSTFTNNKWYRSASGKLYRNKWIFNENVPTPEDIKCIVALVVKYLIKTGFKGHIYEYKNKIYLQRKGGPIGLRLSGSIARIVLLWFNMKMLTAGY